MPGKEVGPEVQRMLEDLQMVDKTKAHAKYLSGGMKRKLRYMQLSFDCLE